MIFLVTLLTGLAGFAFISFMDTAFYYIGFVNISPSTKSSFHSVIEVKVGFWRKKAFYHGNGTVWYLMDENGDLVKRAPTTVEMTLYRWWRNYKDPD